jgi:pyruvate decarboxylase
MNVSGVRMFNQTVFGSIGYATGAALGAFIAGKEDGSIKRGILVTGEGSLQLTVQTFSDLLRHRLNTTVYGSCSVSTSIESILLTPNRYGEF